MSDDPANKPPKLKLQRPSQTKESSDAPKAQLTPPLKTEPSTPEPLPKLVPKKPIEENSIKANEISSPTPVPEPEEAAPKATPPLPKNPPAPKAPSTKPTQELAPGLQNRLDERPPAGVEQHLQESLKATSTPAPEATKARSSVGTSIALIIVLMLILGGGGYAVWEMFMQAEATPETSQQTATETPEQPKNPIEHAKANIDKVPVADIDAITGESAEPVAPDAPENAITESKVSTPPEPTAQTGDLRTSVSGFLSSTQIGMVRTGANARVMLNSESFRIGDVVDSNTGLIFLGTQEGKLVFKDRNEVTYHKSF